jgi:hypothetical protein
VVKKHTRLIKGRKKKRLKQPFEDPTERIKEQLRNIQNTIMDTIVSLNWEISQRERYRDQINAILLIVPEERDLETNARLNQLNQSLDLSNENILLLQNDLNRLNASRDNLRRQLGE